MNHNEFPAILVGGPPHSGKSVLLYHLSQRLRARQVSHYVLRACPDGEGDWLYHTSPDVVQTIRVKGAFTAEFTQQIIAYLQQRPLPLLVDVGGRPTPEQEAIFAHCTHALLLIGDRSPQDTAAFERDRQQWSQMMARQRLPILETIRSTLADTEPSASEPSHFKTISGLHREGFKPGLVFEGLANQLARMMHFSEAQLAAVHQARLPADHHFLNVEKQANGRDGRLWQPADLPELVDELPADGPLAVYGRSANWVYATVAAASMAAPFTMFDAKLGWVTVPTLPRRGVHADDDWQVTLQADEDATVLKMSTRSQYLAVDQPEQIPLPVLPADKGVILTGRIPHWLLTAVCRQLAPTQSWLAVHQPGELAAAVVVASCNPAYELGQILPYDPESGG